MESNRRRTSSPHERNPIRPDVVASLPGSGEAQDALLEGKVSVRGKQTDPDGDVGWLGAECSEGPTT